MYGTFYTFPAKYFTEALPLGNGSTSVMLYGGVQTEKFSLNHDTLWAGIPKKVTKPEAYEAFEKAKKLVLDGKYSDAHRELTDNFLGLNTNPYLPMGNLYFDFFHPEKEGYRNYSRRLDFENAVAFVEYDIGTVHFKRECFVSYPDGVCVAKFVCTDVGRKAPFKALCFDAHFDSPLKADCFSENQTLFIDGECPGISNGKTDEKLVEYEYSSDPKLRGVQFRGGLRIISDGKISFEKGVARVCGASEATILLSVSTSFNGYNKHPFTEGKEYKQACIATLDNAQRLGFKKLFERHTADFCSLYNRISLDLGKSGRENMPTDERIKLFNADKAAGVAVPDISLYTLLFDFGRYLTIASSRKGTQATNLQGIWNELTVPPWRSNYTVNINTEMNYWPTLMCGLDECFEPLVSFMLDRSAVDTGMLTAKHFYHARGFTMHHNSDLWAHTTAISNDAVYGFWNGASGWLCHNLYEYYEYTADKEYLLNICFPIMKKAAMFYLDVLCECDGALHVVPATSPENRFLTEDSDGKKVKAAVAKYTAMSDCIAYELFLNCKKIIAGHEVAVCDGFEAELDRAIAGMKPLQISTDGRIMEWNEEFEENQVNHRHVSQLYALHPARLITPDGTPELADACRKSLVVRGDAGTGWSLAWKMNLYARLFDGNHALKLVDMQLNYVDPGAGIDYGYAGGTFPNLFDAHPPFQIDGNFGTVSGMLEMLAGYDKDGNLKILPALPDAWKNGSLRGMRIKGGKILDLEWQNGKVTSSKIYDK